MGVAGLFWICLISFCFSSGGMALDLRCHCNLPICVGTSYMCRSSVGCFQELPTGEDFLTARPRHGCLELWPMAQKLHCVPELRRQKLHSGDLITSTNPATHIRRKSHSTRRNADVHQLRCCTEDMCNYVQFEATEWSIASPKMSQFDMLGSQEQIGVNGANLSPTQLVATHTDSTVWMRAALIAVPLAGTLILLLLVLVACWLLKFDLKYLSDSSRLLQEEKNLFLTKKPTVAAKNEYVDGCHSLIHSTTSLKAKLISPQGSNDISSTVHPTGVRRLFCPTQPNLLPWKPFASPVQQPIFTPSRRQYDCESAAAETTVSEESQQLCDKDTIMSSHLPLSP